MGATVLVFLFVLSGQKAANHVYQNSQCSYSFEYPNEWQIVKNPDYRTGECSTTLRPADYEKRMAEDDVDVYTVTVQVSEGTFLQAASENGFDFDGQWTVLGRQGLSAKAQVTNANGWMILQGTAAVGCLRRAATPGCAPSTGLSPNNRSDGRIVVIVAAPQAEVPAGAILKTFKFLTR
jgi:hypothetical protein